MLLILSISQISSIVTSRIRRMIIRNYARNRIGSGPKNTSLNHQDLQVLQVLTKFIESEAVVSETWLLYPRIYNNIGIEKNLSNTKPTITSINTDTLYGEVLEFSSISNEMSRASDRQWTRTEDAAHCLLWLVIQCQHAASLS